MKPKLTVIAGRPVTLPAPQSAHDMKLSQARQRHGKPFGFGARIDSSFKWNREPTVLAEWLQRRKS